MSEARNAPPAAADGGLALSIALAALLRGKAPEKVAKMCARLIDEADDVEFESLQRADVISIRSRIASASHPGNLQMLEAARLLRARAELAGKLYGGG